MRPFVPCRFARSPSSASPSFLLFSSLLTLALTLHSISLLFHFQKTPHKTPKKKTENKQRKKSLAERFYWSSVCKIPASVCCIPAQNSQFRFSHGLFLPSFFFFFTWAPVLSSVSHRILSFLLSTTYCIKFFFSLSLSLSMCFYLSRCFSLW